MNSSDDEEIQSNYNSCLFELSKAINYIKNNPNFFEDKIIIEKNVFSHRFNLTIIFFFLKLKYIYLMELYIIMIKLV